ncbi:MAG: nucleotidyl transferase AbiEii/AbiGii toxin family protein [archaeon]|nr:nucleotidyl transferase AbiEii/AbiGii toxin family protein [archaeon]
MDLISKAKLQNIAAEKGFNLIYLEKDYFLTALLYLMKDIDGLYFKGGTALNKIVFNHTRLSEDLDFTCTTKISEAKKKIEQIVKENSNLFTGLETDKESEKFTRIQVYYKSYFREKEFINVDLNSHAKTYLEPEKKQVKHFYKELPDFSITMLNQKELVAEKIRALFQRNQPRDYFDAYQIISSKQKIDEKLVRQKLKEIGLNYDIDKIFKNAKKIYSKWEQETSLTNKPITYKTAITTIAKHFKYKEKKKKTKKTNTKKSKKSRN